MPNDPDQSSLPLSLGHRPGLSFDMKADLGYGIGKSKFHEPRSSGSEFPYILDDEESQIDLSDEYSEEFLKKLSNKQSQPFLCDLPKKFYSFYLISLNV